MSEKDLEQYRFQKGYSSEKAAENGRKGGYASGRSKRRRKSLQKTIETILSLPVNEQTKQALEKMGVSADEFTVQTAIVVSQAMKAMQGDTKAAMYIATYGGYDPKLEVEKERIRMEKERLELQKSLGIIPTETAEEKDENDVVIYLPEIDEGDEAEEEPDPGIAIEIDENGGIGMYVPGTDEPDS